MASEAEAAIDVQQLSYAYRSDWLLRRVVALHPLTLKVVAGECFGFLGHNGAGKTTTIKCLLSLIRPASGSIRIFGCPSSDVGARASVGYLPEQPYFYDHLSVQELLEMYATLSGIPAASRTRSVARALARVRLDGRGRSRMRTLSKGLTQRVAMAQAIVHEPKLLILDEPFSGLDPLGRREFRNLIMELKQEGATIFICSHVLSDVEFLCDRVAIMARGALKGVFSMAQIRSRGKPHFELELISTADKARTFAQHSQIETRGDIQRLLFVDEVAATEALRRALGEHIPVLSFARRSSTLEDAFVELVGEGYDTKLPGLEGVQ